MSTITTIDLFGAGGKMGARLARNLMSAATRDRVRHVEPGAAGRQRLKDELGIDCVDTGAALDGAQVVILAVPDTLIGKIAAQIAPQLAPGTMVITLDAGQAGTGVRQAHERRHQPRARDARGGGAPGRGRRRRRRGTPEKFADFMRAERDKYIKLARDAQIKIES